MIFYHLIWSPFINNVFWEKRQKSKEECIYVYRFIIVETQKYITCFIYIGKTRIKINYLLPIQSSLLQNLWPKISLFTICLSNIYISMQVISFPVLQARKPFQTLDFLFSVNFWFVFVSNQSVPFEGKQTNSSLRISFHKEALHKR